MLYRAICYQHDLSLDTGEFVVFFESNPSLAHERLCALLTQLWQVPPERVEFYNLDDEPALRSHSMAPDAATSDLALLSTGGCAARDFYSPRHRYLFLVSPARHKRLSDALDRVPHAGGMVLERQAEAA